jgi:hypothetical protein
MREPKTYGPLFWWLTTIAACAEGRPPANRAAAKVECGPPSGEGLGRPFDRGAAAKALGEVRVQECRRQVGRGGSARVEMTVCPDGITRGATVIEAQFDDEQAWRCIEAKFNGVKMPPFEGDGGAPVHVKKAITLE